MTRARRAQRSSSPAHVGPIERELALRHRSIVYVCIACCMVRGILEDGARFMHDVELRSMPLLWESMWGQQVLLPRRHARPNRTPNSTSRLCGTGWRKRSRWQICASYPCELWLCLCETISERWGAHFSFT